MAREIAWDVVVIGGGPAGSTAAHYLAKAGRKVVLLEKDLFPRFHIGESLLPYNRIMFEEMGIVEELERAGFPRKYGAQFHTVHAAQSAYFDFRLGQFNREREAFQVERAVFDRVLLEAAEKAGAEIRREWRVTGMEEKEDGIQVEACGPGNQTEVIAGRFCVDGSGRSNFSGDRFGDKVPHPKLRKLSVFGHFRRVRLDEGDRAGDTVIVRLEDGWFWIIPIGHGKVSVGCVVDRAAWTPGPGAAAAFFEKRVQSSSVLRERLANAELIGELQVTTDFSYRNRRFVRGRIVRVGDAAGFIDPIFSSGVFLAMYSARLAARTVAEILEGRASGLGGLQTYEKRLGRAMDFYLRMVEGFYTVPFMEILLHPHPRWGLAAAVNAMLAGEVEAGWSIRWRLGVFLLLTRLQSWIPIAPRLKF